MPSVVAGLGLEVGLEEEEDEDGFESEKPLIAIFAGGSVVGSFEGDICALLSLSCRVNECAYASGGE